MKLNFELTVDEANLILAALSKMPFEQVVNLINSIKTTAEKQIAARGAETQPSE